MKKSLFQVLLLTLGCIGFMHEAHTQNPTTYETHFNEGKCLFTLNVKLDSGYYHVSVQNIDSATPVSFPKMKELNANVFVHHFKNVMAKNKCKDSKSEEVEFIIQGNLLFEEVDNRFKKTKADYIPTSGTFTLKKEFPVILTGNFSIPKKIKFTKKNKVNINSDNEEFYSNTQINESAYFTPESHQKSYEKRIQEIEKKIKDNFKADEPLFLEHIYPILSGWKDRIFEDNIAPKQYKIRKQLFYLSTLYKLNAYDSLVNQKKSKNLFENLVKLFKEKKDIEKEKSEKEKNIEVLVQNHKQTIKDLETKIKSCNNNAISDSLYFLNKMAENVDSNNINIVKVDFSELNKELERIIENVKKCHTTPDTVHINTILTTIKELKEKNNELKIKENSIQFKIDSLNKLFNGLIPIFITENCVAEFEGGAIKNLMIHGTLNNKPYTLTNRFPITISSKTDPEDFKFIKLYEPNDWKFFILMNKAIIYEPFYTKNAEDYSPADTIATFYPNQTNAPVFKENRTEILKGRIFTDLMGIDPDNPNGLIQTDVSKRVNLYTRIFGPQTRRKNLGTLDKYNVYMSLLAFYEPGILWSKIEANNRSLPVLVAPQDSANNRYAATLQILRYSFLNVKPIYFNIIGVHFPKIKTSLGLNVGTSWIMTSFSDRIEQQIDSTTKVIESTRKTGNSVSFNTDLFIQIKPDTRYGFNMNASMIYLRMFNNEIKQTGNTTDIQNSKVFPWILNFRLDAFYKPFRRVDGEIFLRFNSFFQPQNLNQNFLQLQLGTAVRFIK